MFIYLGRMGNREIMVLLSDLMKFVLWLEEAYLEDLDGVFFLDLEGRICNLGLSFVFEFFVVS